jgi:hypothetical protein
VDLNAIVDLASAVNWAFPRVDLLFAGRRAANCHFVALMSDGRKWQKRNSAHAKKGADASQAAVGPKVLQLQALDHFRDLRAAEALPWDE